VIINQANLRDLFRAYNSAFKQGLGAAQPQWQDVATQIPSSTRENHYAWLGQFPKLREWLGDRVIKSMAAYDYTIKNRKFESTVGVPRDDIEDDTYGVFTPLMEEMGRSAMTHPDELIFSLLAAGDSTECFDGQYFFDTDHPVAGKSVSNVETGGSGKNWYLMDLSRALKPLIFQKRRDYDFRSMTNLNDDHVFMTDQFKFGVDARVNAGFGFWQQAYASNKTLNNDNFNADWAALAGFKSDEGRPLGTRPTHLVVGISNRAAAKAAIEVERLANGASNPNFQAVEVIVSPYLD